MIKEFQSQYRWLSNFYPVVIEYEGRKYPSVEHAYMSVKSTDIKWKLKCADPNNSPGYIKRESRKVQLLLNWEEVKENVMFTCLLNKFTQEPFMTQLKETFGQHIQEGNNWGDKYWGVDLKTGEGKNVLGNLIMKIRDEILL